MESLTFILKKISSANESPLRFGLFQEEMVVSFSLETKKEFFRKERADLGISVTLDDGIILENIKNYEYRFLYQSMMQYLARQEVAPLKLQKWLNKRKLDADTQTLLMSTAEKEKFLSVERFIRFWTEKRFSEGKKPWWIVKREIEEQVFLGGETLEEIEKVKTLLEEVAYDDLKLLLKNKAWIKEITFPEKTEKIKHKLITRGFHYSTITQWCRLAHSGS